MNVRQTPYGMSKTCYVVYDKMDSSLFYFDQPIGAFFSGVKICYRKPIEFSKSENTFQMTFDIWFVLVSEKSNNSFRRHKMA